MPTTTSTLPARPVVRLADDGETSRPTLADLVLLSQYRAADRIAAARLGLDPAGRLSAI